MLDQQADCVWLAKEGGGVQWRVAVLVWQERGDHVGDERPEAVEVVAHACGLQEAAVGVAVGLVEGVGRGGALFFGGGREQL